MGGVHEIPSSITNDRIMLVFGKKVVPHEDDLKRGQGAPVARCGYRVSFSAREEVTVASSETCHETSRLLDRHRARDSWTGGVWWRLQR